MVKEFLSPAMLEGTARFRFRFGGVGRVAADAGTELE
jgi:hypothetical protein